MAKLESIIMACINALIVLFTTFRVLYTFKKMEIIHTTNSEKIIKNGVDYATRLIFICIFSRKIDVVYSVCFALIMGLMAIKYSTGTNNRSFFLVRFLSSCSISAAVGVISYAVENPNILSIVTAIVAFIINVVVVIIVSIAKATVCTYLN